MNRETIEYKNINEIDMIKLEIEDFMANWSDQDVIRSGKQVKLQIWTTHGSLIITSIFLNTITLTLVTSSEKLTVCFIVSFPIKVSGEIEIIGN